MVRVLLTRKSDVYDAARSLDVGGRHASFSTGWLGRPSQHLPMSRPATYGEYRGVMRRVIVEKRDRQWGDQELIIAQHVGDQKGDNISLL